MPLTFAVANNDVVEVTSFQEYQGSVTLNVIHYRAVVSGAPIADGEGEMNTLLDKMVDALGGFEKYLADMVVADVVFGKMRAQIVTPSRKPYVDRFTGTNGAEAGAGCPSNVAGVVTKRGSVASRGRMGSIHVTGFPLSRLIDASWDNDAIAEMEDLGDFLNTAQSGDDPSLSWVPVVGKNQLTGGEWNDLIACTAQRTVRVMRRRTLHVGI
jgi:hypothetical protein